MPYLFNVAALAIKNAPDNRLVLPDGTPATLQNPAAPLLFAFFVTTSRLCDDPRETVEQIKQAAAHKIVPTLPHGYALTLVNVNPADPAAILGAAAQILGTPSAPLSNETAGPGSRIYDERTGEGVFDSYRPGCDEFGKSPRFAFRCPYCGSTALRFTQETDVRTNEGYRVRIDQNDHATERHRFMTGSLSSGPPPTSHRSAISFCGMDSDGSVWQDRPGVSFVVTCPTGHRSVFRFREDAEENPDGATIFLFFEYGENPAVMADPTRPGEGVYPFRAGASNSSGNQS